MPTVQTNPFLLGRSLEDTVFFNVLQKFFIAGFVSLLNSGNSPENFSNLSEAFSLCSLGKFVIHISPLVVLTLGSPFQAVLCGTHSVNQFKPNLGMLFLVGCRFGENTPNLLISLFFGNAGKPVILISCHALACNSIPEVFLGLSALQFFNFF